MLPFYSSFRFILLQSFVENHKNVLPNYAQLCAVKKELNKEDIVEGGYIYGLLYIALFSILYRCEVVMGEHIRSTEDLCNLYLKSINEKINNGDTQKQKAIFEELKTKKIKHFRLKSFLYKAS